jgi:hypothetical protein
MWAGSKGPAALLNDLAYEVDEFEIAPCINTERRTIIDYDASRIVRADTSAHTVRRRVRTAHGESTTVTPTLLPARAVARDACKPVSIAHAGALDATTPCRRRPARRRVMTTLEWNAEWDEDRVGAPLARSWATGCSDVRLRN